MRVGNKMDLTPNEINLKAYERISTRYHEQTKTLEMKWQQEIFLDMIPKQGSILDAMCGSGRDLKEFESRGYTLSAVDQSQNMLDIVQKEAPSTTLYKQDITTLNLDTTYDGIWCSAGIFMLEKDKVPLALHAISQHLKTGGALFMNCKLGKGGGAYFDKRYNIKRHEIYFQSDELKQLLENENLDIRREMISYAQNPKYKTHPFKDYFCIKK